jgi:hypothetical protein
MQAARAFVLPRGETGGVAPLNIFGGLIRVKLSAADSAGGVSVVEAVSPPLVGPPQTFPRGGMVLPARRRVSVRGRRKTAKRWTETGPWLRAANGGPRGSKPCLRKIGSSDGISGGPRSFVAAANSVKKTSIPPVARQPLPGLTRTCFLRARREGSSSDPLR